MTWSNSCLNTCLLSVVIFLIGGIYLKICKTGVRCRNTNTHTLKDEDGSVDMTQLLEEIKTMLISTIERWETISKDLYRRKKT